MRLNPLIDIYSRHTMGKRRPGTLDLDLLLETLLDGFILQQRGVFPERALSEPPEQLPTLHYQRGKRLQGKDGY